LDWFPFLLRFIGYITTYAQLAVSPVSFPTCSKWGSLSTRTTATTFTLSSAFLMCFQLLHVRALALSMSILCRCLGWLNALKT
jgi:hypothetical protein